MAGGATEVSGSLEGAVKAIGMDIKLLLTHEITGFTICWIDPSARTYESSMMPSEIVHGSDFTRRPTLKDVAEEAGVSRATASLVLRRSPLVAQATRERVQHAMEKLGYVYNRAAANLRQRTSHSVALVVPDLRNPFYAALAEEVERHIEDSEFILFVASTGESPKKQRKVIESMLEYGVAGIILSPAASSKVEDLSDLVEGPTPFVLTTRWTDGVSADYVGYDNEKGAERAVSHLLTLGHRRVAFMAGQTESSAGQERLSGYLRAHGTAGIPVDDRLIYSHPITTEAAYQGIQRLLAQPNPPTAVFCFNDYVAHGVLFGLWEYGVVPGRDVAVVGFDNLDESEHWRPALTTVDYPREVLGRATARLLTERLEDPALPVRTVIYEPTLVIRETCGSGNGSTT